jgi:hypothetical protein
VLIIEANQAVFKATLTEIVFVFPDPKDLQSKLPGEMDGSYRDE